MNIYKRGLPLTASGDLLLPVVERALNDETLYEAETLRRLVRICGRSKRVSMIAVLRRHFEHPNPTVQQDVLLALHCCNYRVEAEDQPSLAAALHSSVRHGLRLLMAQHEIGEGAALGPLHTALKEELNGLRQRVFLLLALLYDASILLRLEQGLSRGNNRTKAMALEMLDVTLTGAQKTVVLPLVDENMALLQRVAALNKHFSLPSLNRQARLSEIITNTNTWTQQWTRACAIYAAGKLLLHTATWALTRLTPLAQLTPLRVGEAAPTPEPG